jgi:metal-responsive CopG/Arc/MetJ family transcriptional regulator
MKAAVSLPDDLFAAADALASRLGVSRSRLIALALAEFSPSIGRPKSPNG